MKISHVYVDKVKQFTSDFIHHSLLDCSSHWNKLSITLISMYVGSQAGAVGTPTHAT